MHIIGIDTQTSTLGLLAVAKQNTNLHPQPSSMIPTTTTNLRCELQEEHEQNTAETRDEQRPPDPAKTNKNEDKKEHHHRKTHSTTVPRRRRTLPNHDRKNELTKNGHKTQIHTLKQPEHHLKSQPTVTEAISDEPEENNDGGKLKTHRNDDGRWKGKWFLPTGRDGGAAVRG
jgi:hypothetical protein